MVACALSAEAREKGLVISSLAQAAKDTPELVRAFIEGGGSLPHDDTFGHVARAFHSLGLFIHVPAGIDLAAPIVLRWSAGAPGFGLISRTVISLGENAHASVFEEQVPSTEAAIEPGARADAVWWGTTEVDLAEGATLHFAGEQNFGPATATFVGRRSVLTSFALRHRCTSFCHTDLGMATMRALGSGGESDCMSSFASTSVGQPFVLTAFSTSSGFSPALYALLAASSVKRTPPASSTG